MRLSAGLLAGFLCFASPSGAAPEPPSIQHVVEQVARSLGGREGGRAALLQAKELDFVFRRTVRDVLTGKELVADHRFVAMDAGDRIRLDIRIVSGDGKDSGTVVTPDRAWVVAEGARHEISSGNPRSRLGEFAPSRIFSVPFALGADGAELLGDAAIDVVGWTGEGADRRLLLLGRDAAGEESARLELDAARMWPVRVSFVSTGGQVVYRYADYREIAPGLVVPFERELLRNGQRVSSIKVLRLKLDVRDGAGLFDPELSTLPAIPGA